MGCLDGCWVPNNSVNTILHKNYRNIVCWGVFFM